MLQLVVIALAVAAGVTSFPVNCNRGPSYWCQNKATAEECGVLEFCIQDPEFHRVNPVHKPVKVELYYESLCGDCQMFIRGQLWPAWKKLEDLKIMDLQLYPFGNAREKKVGKSWKFTCQHGMFT